MKAGREPAAPEGTKPTRGSRATWHLLPIYYLLAAFGVFTLSMSLYLNHRMMVIYAGSVETNHNWAGRLAQYSELGQLAAEVNAPGNDVFNSHEVEAEAARMRAALRRFRESLAALREELRANVDAGRAAALLEDFGALDTAMAEMANEAERIFFYLAQNLPRLAGAQMATMDRKYADVNVTLARLRTQIIAIQQERFAEEIRAAAALQKFEYVIGVLVLLMVGGTTAYGYRLATQVTAHEQERERYIASLQDAEGRTRSILNTAADGIVTFDEHGVIESVNRSAEGIFGYSASELIGWNLKGLLLPPYPDDHDGALARHPPDGEAGSLEYRPADLAGRVLEVTGRRKDGTAFPLDLAVSEMLVGRQRMFTGVVRDITERNGAEAQLRSSRAQLQALAARVESLREDERSRIAREIHDELGEMLTGLKIGLSWLAQRLPDDGIALRAKARAMSTMVDNTIQSVRRISRELRPQMLDGLGLAAAVEWQAQEFQEQTGIHCQCSSSLADLKPDREASTAIGGVPLDVEKRNGAFFREVHNHQPAATHGGPRRNAPWESIPGNGTGCMRAKAARSES